jgi:hypothetical protein
MNLDDLNEMCRHLVSIPPVSEVHTGSLDRFLAAVEKRTGSIMGVEKSTSLREFMGIKIIEDPLLPPNRALVKQGLDVVAVINLD